MYRVRTAATHVVVTAWIHHRIFGFGQTYGAFRGTFVFIDVEVFRTNYIAQHLNTAFHGIVVFTFSGDQRDYPRGARGSGHRLFASRGETYSSHPENTTRSLHGRGVWNEL